jgi:hypothetical protein
MGNTYVDGAPTFEAGEALEKYRRVKLTAARTVSYADAGEDSIGVTLSKVASGEQVAIRPFNAEGTILVIAAGAFAVNADLYGAADGKVDDAVSGNKQLIALEAASADGDAVEAIATAPSDLLALQSLISDPAASAAMTFAAGSIDTGTDMTAAEAAAIVTDLAALKTAIDANNAAIDSVIDALQANGIVATA